MKKLLLLSFAVLVMLFWILPVNAKTLDVATEYKDTIGQYIQVYQSDDSHLSMHDAFDAFRNGHFSLSDNPVINFGIGSKPVWLALQISNSGKIAMHRNLLIETAWLDKIDVHYFQQEQLINSYHTGDSLLFAERPLNHRFFVMGHDFTQGETTILIRIESADAMVLPIYLLDNEKLNDRDKAQAYSYGFMYGVILALVAYNFMLYIGLRAAPYLLYSIYLLFFLALNAAYTGHGYQWLWFESPQWQHWANPVLMMACTVSGFAFALHFLAIKITWPRVYRVIIASCAGFSALILLAMLVDEFVIALLISIGFIFFFYISSVILGVISLRADNKFAKYFLLASIFSICGGTITANAVWGFIPFNWLTYRATDIGMMADAILLALALA